MAKKLKSTRFRPRRKPFLSGNFKKWSILPFMAGVLIATTVCTFYFTQKEVSSQKLLNQQRQRTVLDEYQYKESLIKPALEESTASAKIQLKVPIIMYHYVEYVKDRGDKTRISLNINPDTFENQLQTLQKNNYQTYYVKDLVDALDGKKQLSGKSIVLTFDDGYEDFYTYVLPLLEKYDVKATLYVIYNLVDSKGYLTKDELKEIVASGLVEIGSHTLRHAYLKGLSPAVQQREITQSKKVIEDMLGIQVKTFAYPYGAFDQSAIDFVKEASYSAAVSVIPGNVHTTNERYYLYRIRAGGFTGPNMIENVEKDYGTASVSATTKIH